MINRLSILSIAAFLLWGATSQASELLSGPMIGHTTTDSAKIWLETDRASDVRILYWQEPKIQYRKTIDAPIEKGVAEGRTNTTAPHVGVVELKDLNPGWMIYYELEIDGQVVRPQTPQVFSLMAPNQTRGNTERPPDFSVAFASCMYPARVPMQPIWDQVGSFRPDALMLIGDNNYMPNNLSAYETDAETISYALPRYHRYLRDVPGLRTLLATTPTYGIWDDHDYGPNNSDRTFKWRELSLDLFKKYYPNPSAGTPETPGIFTSFRIADAEFFLLDNRYHRDPNKSPDRKTMLGAAQLAWLKDGLSNSTATFKVVVSGGTILVDRLGSGESWTRFGSERDDFLDWISAEEITGVFFVVGDWHVGTMSRLHRPQDKYPLYELLTSNAAVDLKKPPEFGQNHYKYHQFVGPEYRGFNFGLVRFQGPKGGRTASLEIIDEYGEARVSLRLREADLRAGWREINSK